MRVNIIMPSKEAINLVESVLNESLRKTKDKTCSCCGKKQGFFKSFSDVKTNSNDFSLCSYCSDILYAIKGAKKEKDENAVSELKAEIENRMKKGNNKEFQNWYSEEF